MQLKKFSKLPDSFAALQGGIFLIDMNAATMSFRQLKAQTLNLILENKTTFCNHLAKSWTGFAKRILIFSPFSLKVMPVAARKVSGSALL